MVINPSHQKTECGGDHEGSLAEVWQELLHQVRNDSRKMVSEMLNQVPNKKYSKLLRKNVVFM